MRIESLKNNTDKREWLLLKKLITMNDNSDCNYLENDTIETGVNKKTNYAYAWIESYPNLCICNDGQRDLIIYSSSLDGIKFVKYTIPKRLETLENITNKAYIIEADTRGDDYKDETKKDKFINKMLSNGWGLL